MSEKQTIKVVPELALNRIAAPKPAAHFAVDVIPKTHFPGALPPASGEQPITAEKSKAK